MSDDSSEGWPDAEQFDGGATGCGELLLDLLIFMKRQPPGTFVKVRALDSGAPLEIPAWCRLTGNALREAAHPFYLLQTKPAEK